MVIHSMVIHSMVIHKKQKEKIGGLRSTLLKMLTTALLNNIYNKLDYIKYK